MSHLIFFNFGIFHQFLSKSDLPGNAVLPQAPGFQKLAIIFKLHF